MLVRFRGPVLACVAAASVLIALPASRIRLEPDIASLLPENAPAAADYKTFLDAFGGLEKVFVIVEPDPAAPAASDAIAEASVELGERLAADPEIATARSGITEADQAFFDEQVGPRALLLADDAALARFADPTFARESARSLRLALAGPAGVAAAPLLSADPLGLASARLLALSAGGRLAMDPATGAFLAGDGGAALIVVTPARAEVDPAGGRALAATIERCARETEQATGTRLRVRAMGGPLYAAHDEQAIRQDLMRVSGSAVLVVGVVIVAACGGIAIPLAAVLAVLAGLIWTAAFASFALGSVTAIGVGFGAILIGMGDDYVNHLGASYREEILRGRSRLRAFVATLRHTAPGIVTSAITTSAAFATLAFAHFRPLRELGIVVAVGMLLMLLAAFVVGGPTIMLAMRPRRPGKAPSRAPLGWRVMASIVDGCVGFAQRRPRATLTAAAILTLVAAPGLFRLAIDTDPRRLRPENHPAYETTRTLSERFGVGMETSTAVVRGADLGEALDRAAVVAELLRAALPREAEVQSPSDWIVAGRRLASRGSALRALPLEAFATSFERELAGEGFSADAFGATVATMRALARGETPDPPPRATWPDWIGASVRDVPGGIAVAVHVRHPDTLAAWRGGPPSELLERLRRAAPGLAFASVPRVGVELREVGVADLRRLGTIALGLVVLVALISFRGRVSDALFSVAPVALGGVWTLGLWGLLGGRLDLFSLAVAPILVGLGDDSGLHVMHRARALPNEGLGAAAAGSGRAMVLSTITTCAGFGSLLLSQVPALRQGGLLVGTGLFAILAATLFVLPAWEAARRPAASAAVSAERPHAPEGGWAVKLLGPFHVTGIFWYRFHMGAVRMGPRFLTAPVLLAFTSFFWIALRGIRRAVASNLAAVLGPCGPFERERRIFRTFHAFAWCLTERYESHLGMPGFVWETEGEEHWRSLADAQRGFIMLTAHIGNWEVGSMLPATVEHRRVHLVREEEMNPEAQKFVADLVARGSKHTHVTHFAARDAQLGMRLLDALRDREIVALQGDRPRAGGRSVTAAMFGRPMPLPAGVIALARAAGAPILPVFVLREGRCRYRVIFRPPIEVPEHAGRDEAVAAAAQRIAAGLEEAIRRAPEQWFCFRALWPPDRDQTR